MPISIHNNTSSLVTQGHLNRTQKGLNKNLARLSSGMRINSAADDAAGLAVSKEMQTDMKSLAQAKRNANNGISVLQTADSALEQQGSILTRMRELSVQANDGTLSGSQRDNLNEEVLPLPAWPRQYMVFSRSKWSPILGKVDFFTSGPVFVPRGRKISKKYILP